MTLYTSDNYVYSIAGKYSHCHGERAFFRIGTCERQPGDVQGVRECAKGLSPDDTKVSRPSTIDFGEDSIEDITKQVTAEASYYSLASF